MNQTHRQPPLRLSILALLALAGVAWPAEIVLLDEKWQPEIRHNNVKVTPVDTQATGDATQAKFGSKSVMLENAKGWPNVRFRDAGNVVLSQIGAAPKVKLWYRTDQWAGTWQVQLWVYFRAAGRPVKVMEGMLDAGGKAGNLITDNQWHEAAATLVAVDQYEAAPKDQKLVVFLWLSPKAGWNKAHKTFVDRITLVTDDAGAAQMQRQARRPMREVAGKPGAQTNGANWIWFEAEDAVSHTFPAKGGAFAPANAVEQDKLSNRAWLQHHNGAGMTGKWTVDVADAGKYAFWSRKFWKHGPFKWRWNAGDWHSVGRNIALADNVTIRLHLNANWVYLGEADLSAGKNTLGIEVLPEAKAVAFDCWLLSKGPFMPDGANKPGKKYNRAEEGWFAFEPDADPFTAEALLDLRGLNQKRAGDDGFVKADGMRFVFEKSGKPVQFWAVNASCDFDDRSAVRYLARRLAKLGVNLVRVHGRVWDASAADLTTIDKRRIDQLHYYVKAMADEGVYTKLSFYFPLWVSMKASYGFPGYKKGEHPFALLFYEPRFRSIYKTWARELLTSPNPYTGKPLAADPAVAVVEVVNEDNLLFWTFKPGKQPPRQMMPALEKAFGDWLVAKYGSMEDAARQWGRKGRQPKGDDFANGRVALYDAGSLTGQSWAVRSRNAKRASDQLQFMTEHLRGFYTNMVTYFRDELGVKCAISATNWKTADPSTLGALDKYTNMACDVIDRHAYFSSSHAGNAANYSLRVGHTYADTTGLFGPRSLTKELQYVAHPHMVSEYNYPMPNRFRAECTWLAATYGRLNGTDAYFHFALGKADWERQHPKFSIYTPAIMGQFPGAALLYRMGYVKEGPVVSHSAVALGDLYAFKGTPAAEEQNLDALRTADIPKGGAGEVDRPAGVDPLAYYVGQVTMAVGEEPGKSKVMDLSPYVDRRAKIVRSATGELTWDWGKGIVTLNASHAQGACGFLGKAGAIELGDVTLEIANEYAALLLVSLDGKPLAESERMLLQVMTEDRNYSWRTQEVRVKGQPRKRIASLGAPPIVVRRIDGRLSLKRGDAAPLRVTALDHNGYARRRLPRAGQVQLLSDCLYYVLEK